VKTCPPKAGAAAATRENVIPAREARLSTAPFRSGCSVFSINSMHSVYILPPPVPEIAALGTAPYRYCQQLLETKAFVLATSLSK